MPALAFAFGVGIAVGLVNGIAIGVFHVNPLIMTLGMASVLLGIVTVGLRGWLAGSTNVLDVVRQVGSQTLIGPLPKNIVVWAVIALILVLGLRSSGLGRMIYAVGDNQIACRLRRGARVAGAARRLRHVGTAAPRSAGCCSRARRARSASTRRTPTCCPRSPRR